MDETELEEVVTVGQRLREAREAQGMSIEDVAAQTRIPTRHLASLEASEWDKLPAATYSVGFAKNYAGAVGLDRNEIGDQLRAEMGGTRPAPAHPEIFEAVDPARTMPKGLVIGALVLLVLVVLALTWMNNNSLEVDEPVAEASNVSAPAANEVAPAATPAAATPVVLTATDAVWIEVKDGTLILKQGQLAPGDRYEVPANAAAPVLTTGKPEALAISVGSQQAPAVGQAGTRVSGVSLKAADLLRPAPTTAAATQPPRPATTPPTQPRASSRPQAAPVPPPAETPDPATRNDNNSAAPGNTGATATPS
jgi:cytoskeletal protein RodZ